MSSAALRKSGEKPVAWKTWRASAVEMGEDKERDQVREREREHAVSRERDREYNRKREPKREPSRERRGEKEREQGEEKRDQERERDEKREKIKQANGNGVVFSAQGFVPGTRWFLVRHLPPLLCLYCADCLSFR
jgi:hypothetical protein